MRIALRRADHVIGEDLQTGQFRSAHTTQSVGVEGGSSRRSNVWATAAPSASLSGVGARLKGKWWLLHISRLALLLIARCVLLIAVWIDWERLGLSLILEWFFVHLLLSMISFWYRREELLHFFSLYSSISSAVFNFFIVGLYNKDSLFLTFRFMETCHTS